MASVLAFLQNALLSPAQPSQLGQLLPLLALHQPFASAGSNSPEHTKFLRTLDSLVVGKDEAGRLVGWKVAREILDQEARAGPGSESSVVDKYGRSWVATLNGLAGQKKLAEVLLPAYAGLLSTVYRTSALHPQFARESILPQLQKLVLALLSFFPPSAPLSQVHLDTILPILPGLVGLHPASLRPLQGQLSTLSIRALTHIDASPLVKKSAVELYAALPDLVGKSASPQAFHAAVLAALESAHQGADALFEGIFDEPARERDGEGVKFVRWEEERREKDAFKRKGTGKARVEAGVRLVAGALRQATERAVPVPIGSILALALRLFRVTSSTPLTPNASPEEVNVTLSLLPELHSLASALVGQLTLSVGPSMMPHTTEVYSHLVYLSEQTTSPVLQTTLLKTLTLVSTNVGPLAPSRDVSASLVERCVKACLRTLGGSLLPVRESNDDEVESTGGKGKGKRTQSEMARNILATATLPLSLDVQASLHAALALLEVILPHPALPPATHVLSTKVLLSIAFSLPHSLVVGGAARKTLEETVARLLAEGVESGPVAREGGVGPELGWVVNSIGSSSRTSDEVSRFLNPILPPTHQPLPSLESTLIFLAPGPTESGTRIEIGFVNASDSIKVVDQEEDDVKMDVAEPAVQAAPAPVLSSFAQQAAERTAVVDVGPKVDPFALPAMPTPTPAPAPVAASLAAPPALAPTPAATPALQPLPAATKGVEVALPVPTIPSTSASTASVPVTGGWQGEEDEGADKEESDDEIPEIDMGDDTDDEDDD